MLGEEGRSCLSERTRRIKGVISPEGGDMRVSVTHTPHSLSRCTLPGSRSSDSPPPCTPHPSLPPSTPMCLPFLSSITPSLPSCSPRLPHAPHVRVASSSFLPPELPPPPSLSRSFSAGGKEGGRQQWRWRRRRWWQAPADGCYSNHTSDAARVQ